MPSADVLAAACRELASPSKADRERAEATLLSARADAIPALVEAVDEHTAVGRAALLLGALKARAALPALYRAVDRLTVDGVSGADELAFVARTLAELLEGQDAFDDRARDALEKLSRARDASTRAFAAQAYGALGDLRSKARVQALAADVEPWVRDKAAAVLARLAETEALAASEEREQREERAPAEADRGLRAWLDDLGDLRRPVRAAAVAELVKAGKPAVPALLEKLNQPHTRARIGAAQALGQLQAVDAAGPLLVAATAPAATPDEADLRGVALRALASCLTGTEEGLAASILPLARDRDRFVRAAALLCLGRLADRQGLDAIVAAIVEDDPFVVESAAIALSEGAREEDTAIVVPLLSALERAPRPVVREAILLALSRVLVDDEALRVRVRHRVRRVIRSPELSQSTASARKAAIVLLERSYDDADPPPLPLVDDVLQRLDDDHPEVRLVAASFARTHLPPGMTGAVAPLAAAAARGEAPAALLALEALRRHDTRDARDALEAARASPVLAERAGQLLDGFAPTTDVWAFVPKAPPAQLVGPARAESTRTTGSRVRAAANAANDAQPPPGGEGVVEARFDGDRA